MLCLTLKSLKTYKWHDYAVVKLTRENTASSVKYLRRRFRSPNQILPLGFCVKYSFCPDHFRCVMGIAVKVTRCDFVCDQLPYQKSKASPQSSFKTQDFRRKTTNRLFFLTSAAIQGFLYKVLKVLKVKQKPNFF